MAFGVMEWFTGDRIRGYLGPNGMLQAHVNSDANENVIGVQGSPIAIGISTGTVYAAAAGTVITATGNSGTLPVLTYRELSIDVNISAVTGTTPSITFSLARIGADGVQYTIWTGTAITAVAKQSASIGAGYTAAGDAAKSLGANVVLIWTVSGTTPNFTLSMNVYGK